jgi:hypothetical protein
MSRPGCRATSSARWGTGTRGRRTSGPAPASREARADGARRRPRWRAKQGKATPAVPQARASDARSGAGGCCPGTGTRSSGRRQRGRAREGGGCQSGVPPQMEHARRRPTDWKGGGKRRTRDAEDGRWPGREDASSLAREMHEGRRPGRETRRGDRG